MKNIPYLLALHSIDGLGPIRLKAVLNYFKDPKLAWEANGEELLKLGIYAGIVSKLQETRKKLEPEAYAKEIADKGIKWLTIFDPNYPTLLAQIYDPPLVLYYRGNPESLNNKTIGVVGTRKITGYGRYATQEFTKGLAQAGMTVVSGLAKGVDSQAHLTTVAEGGKTIAVLGGGLNKIFPAENTKLAEKIASGFGAVISEFPPNKDSFPGNFPARNRIISGLSLAVLVVEAAEDSGSLITARLALEQGRDVFAVPGPITSSLSKGPVELIRAGARAVFSPDEILEELGISKALPAGRKVQNYGNLSEEEKEVLELLENESLHIDEIGRILKLATPNISSLLLRMEISGLVECMGAGIYCKK